MALVFMLKRGLTFHKFQTVKLKPGLSFHHSATMVKLLGQDEATAIDQVQLLVYSIMTSLIGNAIQG